MNTFLGQARACPFDPCSGRYHRRKHGNIKIQSRLNTICVAPRQQREEKVFDSSRKKKRKKIDDDSDWELEDHVSSYDSDDSDNVALWTSNADNVDGESDGSDYELGSLLKKKPLAKRKKAKKRMACDVTSVLTRKNHTTQRRVLRYVSFIIFFSQCKSLFFYFFSNDTVSSLLKHFCALRLQDIITMEDLEETHIEWVSPDGKMKQCYNVQTLIKIACKGGKNELLQPPHFRVTNEPKFERAN